MKWPNRLTGTISLADWLNRLLESARSCQLKSGPGYRVKQALDGVVLEIEKGGGAPSALTQYKIDSVGTNYLTCKMFNGTTETGSSVLIAMPWVLRPENKPTATQILIAPTTSPDGYTLPVLQKVYPAYAAGQLINAMPVNYTGVTVSGVELKIIEVAHGRAWQIDWEAMGINIRETQGCDPVSGNNVYAFFLRGLWYSTAKTTTYMN